MEGINTRPHVVTLRSNHPVDRTDTILVLEGGRLNGRQLVVAHSSSVSDVEIVL